MRRLYEWRKTMNNYIKKNIKRYDRGIFCLGLFFSILFTIAFTLIKDSVLILIITSLLLPFALNSLTKLVDEYFKSNNMEAMANEAKTYYDSGIISDEEYSQIKKEIRQRLEDKQYVPRTTVLPSNSSKERSKKS